MVTICPRCRRAYDARRELSADHDPLHLTRGARLCPTCVASTILTDPAAGACPPDISTLKVPTAA